MCCGKALFELSLTADLWRELLVVFLSRSRKCPVLAALNVSSSPSPTFPFLMWRLAQLILPHNNLFPFLFLLCLWSRVFMVPSFFPSNILHMRRWHSLPVFSSTAQRKWLLLLILPGEQSLGLSSSAVRHTGILDLLHHPLRQFRHCHQSDDIADWTLWLPLTRRVSIVFLIWEAWS